MRRWLWLILFFGLSACTGKPPASDKVFSNAQILYQAKEKNSISKRRNMEMASYFIELNYSPGQTDLNPLQINKIDAVFKKLVYPEEYKLYMSFGSGDEQNHYTSVGPMMKRAQDIKLKYGKRVKSVHVAYLKNQKSNVAFLRLIA